MHDPEKFQQETIKAITDLHEVTRQTLSRQLALSAMVRAIVSRIPLAALPAVLEEYEAEVDHLAASLPPKYQQPKHWHEWSEILEARLKELQQQQDQKNGKA